MINSCIRSALNPHLLAYFPRPYDRPKKINHRHLSLSRERPPIESEDPSDQNDNSHNTFSQAWQTRTETPNSQQNKYPPSIYAHQKHVREKKNEQSNNGQRAKKNLYVCWKQVFFYLKEQVTWLYVNKSKGNNTAYC